MKFITASSAASPAGPYSPAVQSGNLLFVSGQIPLAADGSIAGEDIGTQTRQVFTNLKAVLAQAGADLPNIVKTTVFLKDLGDFADMNAVYAEAFGEHRPARSTVQVAKLPRDVRVEIEAIAVLG
ncbi:RidA family protein [Aromatoleum evansii]|uniref:RidA family protein n=1 Tax=Aromatoleum evansii TaxID=59406 RepID=A0ABZ1ATV5_AROEV|nr:RidA family protein [Aromatoleum evansii]NMG31159.1 deaminase [Aromatoleum evansii]WRL48411.1 RidA family protein [Aromatoleum evansii]